jgi:integrase
MAKTKGIFNRGNIWWICYADGTGNIIRESSKSRKKNDAETLLLERKNAVREGKYPIKKIPNENFSHLAEEYSKWCERQRSFRSKKGFIIQLMETFGNVQLRSINTKLIEQFQSDRLKKGNKPATVNRLIATLKHCIHKGYQWEMLSEETLKRVRQVKLLKEDNQRLRILSIEACQSLIENCKGTTQYIVIAALHTGMRKGEILSLKWDNVDLRHGFILLDKTKNGERREIPIDGTLRKVLHGITRHIDIPYVFFDKAKGRPLQDVKKSFHSALKKVEVQKCTKCDYQKAKKPTQEEISLCPLCKSEIRVQRGITDFHFHDLRHTFASHLIMAGIDITAVRKLLGHKTLTMTLRYAHLAPSHMVNAVDILDSILTGKPTTQKLHNQQKEGASL